MDPSLLARAIEDRLADLQTVSLCVVRGVTVPGTVDCQPLAKRAVRTTEEGTAFEEPPILPAVPLIVPGSDRSCLIPSVPLPGDLVLVFFCRESPSALVSGSLTEPEDTSLHSLSHGFALPIARAPGVGAHVALAEPLLTWIGELLLALATGSNSGGPVAWGTPLPAAPVIGAVELSAR